MAQHQLEESQQQRAGMVGAEAQQRVRHWECACGGSSSSRRAGRVGMAPQEPQECGSSSWGGSMSSSCGRSSSARVAGVRQKDRRREGWGQETQRWHKG